MLENFIRSNKGYSSGRYYYEIFIMYDFYFNSGSLSPVCLVDTNDNIMEYRMGYGNIKSGIYINDEMVTEMSYNTNTRGILGVLLDIDQKKVLLYKNRILLYEIDISIFTDTIYAAFKSTPGIYDIEIDYNFGERDFFMFNKWDDVEPYDNTYIKIEHELRDIYIRDNKTNIHNKFYYEVSIDRLSPNLYPIQLSDGINKVLLGGDSSESSVLGCAVDINKGEVLLYKDSILEDTIDISNLDNNLFIEFYIKESSDSSIYGDLEYNFGANEFKNTEWNNLYNQGYLPYDNDNALWLTPKENNTKALYFNGTNAYVSIPHNANQRPNNIYGSLYIRPTELLDEDMTILRYNTNGGIYLKLSPNRDLVFGVMRDGDIEYSEVLYNIAENKIYDLLNIEFLYDGENSKLYIDGDMVASKEYDDNKIIKNGTSSVLMIGKHNVDNKEYFKGNIDEIKLFNKVLSEDMREYYNSSKLLPSVDGLIGYYDFDGDVNDSSNIGNNGIMSGGLYIISDNDLISAPDISIKNISRTTIFDDIDGELEIVYHTTIDDIVEYSIYINNELYEVIEKSSSGNIEISIDYEEFNKGNNILSIRAEYKGYELETNKDILGVSLIGANINELDIYNSGELEEYIINHPDKEGEIIKNDELYKSILVNNIEYNIFRRILNKCSIISISYGYTHTAALKSDGSLVSWGSDRYGQVSNTPKGNDFIQVSCGEYYTIALKLDGSLVSWGIDTYNVVTDTPKGNDFIQVSCGGRFVTALKYDGSLVSWGDNTNNIVSNTPKGNDFIQVSCDVSITNSVNSAIALRSDGSLVSWGYNAYSQDIPKDNGYIQISCYFWHYIALKSDGSLVSWGRDVEKQVSDTPSGNDFIQVSCGYTHATALRSDGSLVSWGKNDNNVVSNTPKGNDFIQVSCGYRVTTALKSDGSLVSWGYDNNKQVSDTPSGNDFIQVLPSIVYLYLPSVEVYNNYIKYHLSNSQISINNNSFVDTTIMMNGELYTISIPIDDYIVVNESNIIEYINKSPLPIPNDKSYKVFPLLNYKLINTTEYTHIDKPIVLEYDDRVFNMSPPYNHLLESSNLELLDNDLYQLSIPTNYRGAIGDIKLANHNKDYSYIKSIPNIMNVPIGEKVLIDLSQDMYSTNQYILYMTMKWTRFADTVKFRILSKDSGEEISKGVIVPHANNNEISIPLPLVNENIMIEFEERESIYNITDIQIMYGGQDFDYTGSRIIYDPVELVSCNRNYSVALRLDGSLLSWGENNSSNNYIVSNTPSGNDFIQVSCGQYHAIALKSDGSLISWGVDDYNVVSNTPSGNDFIQISSGSRSSTVLKSDGSLISWGRDDYNHVSNIPKSNDFIQVASNLLYSTALRSNGSLISWGANNSNNGNIVTNTPKGNDFIQVACGYMHATALKSDGSLVSWGRNDSTSNYVVSNTPNGNDFIQVSCGYNHTTALKSDGSLVSWGGNSNNVVSNTPEGNDFIQVSCGSDFDSHIVALKSDGSLISWGNDIDNVVSDTPRDNGFKIYDNINPRGVLYNPDTNEILDMSLLNNGYVYAKKITHFITQKGIKYLISDVLKNNHSISIDDLSMSTGLNSIIYSELPLTYGLLENARSTQWDQGGNDIIAGKLRKDDLKILLGDIESLKTLSLSYKANIAPQMKDFTLDLATIHSEHAVIRGNILDIEGEDLEIITKIEKPDKTIIEEVLNISYDYTYQKAFSFEENLGMGINKITITVKDPRGLFSSWNTNIEVKNLNPNIVLVYNDRYFTALIEDPENDRVKLKIENTTKNVVLEESGFMDSPLTYKYIFKTGDTNFGVNNNIRFTITDEYGAIVTHTFTIRGVYRSLMFMDEKNNYYTDDSGNLIKPLDFKLIRSGHSKIATFMVSNQTSYDLKNVSLSPFYGNLPEGSIIEFSRDTGEEDWYEVLVLNDILKNGDGVGIKMRVTPPINSVEPNAQFGVDASGTILVGRDGIAEDDKNYMNLIGYNIEY